MEKRRYDVWAAGDAYERYMGRWSRRVAGEFVARLSCPPGARWLDVGCGTGALTATIADRCRPRTVVGLERSLGFVTSARGIVPTATCFAVADAGSLPLHDAVFDVAVSGLMLNFLAAPADSVREAARVVRPGGLVAAYVWDYADGMAFLRHFWDAAKATDPSAAELDEGRRFPVCRPEPLREMWTAAGLLDVAVSAVEVPTAFADFTDLWEPFLAGQGPAPGYVAALAAPSRDRLREALRASVPTQPDGSIALTARAWAVRGRTPLRIGAFSP
ncbi:class I SAM-dependent methyltransferase [Streptomyces sp. NPDC101776]|uniref:class I SAM-dependent methyltransferase n=1 Tax=Streptomyces sp. NPDC101776 TaxID=3366146 RepID=UPI0038035ED3